MSLPKTSILECSHCGNRTPHGLQFEYEHPMLFDEIESEGRTERILEEYTWAAYACGTCGGLNLYGDFLPTFADEHEWQRSKLHPRGAELVPPTHTVSPADPVPWKVIDQYREVWPLRHRAPAAFVGQVRRLLEFIAKDKGANGRDLYNKLQDLTSNGTLPGYFANISDLLRKVGNMGAHAVEEEVSIWDAELIDDFFRAIVEYVYIAPARVRRMENRLRQHEERDEP
jgi:hypothetical protein